MGLISKVQFWDVGLPYLIATYKLHKQKYQWLTNAANCLFLEPAMIITHALHLVITELKVWCKHQRDMYKRFGNKASNLYWVIDSLSNFTLNLLEVIHSVYMADITRCYEIIPLTRGDNLLDALQFLVKMAFHQHHSKLHKEQVIWVHIHATIGKANSTKWSLHCPGSSCWISLSQE